MAATFLRHEGFLGAVGAFLKVHPMTLPVGHKGKGAAQPRKVREERGGVYIDVGGRAERKEGGVAFGSPMNPDSVTPPPVPDFSPFPHSSSCDVLRDDVLRLPLMTSLPASPPVVGARPLR